jgi:hypothetical protein
MVWADTKIMRLSKAVTFATSDVFAVCGSFCSRAPRLSRMSREKMKVEETVFD